MSKMSLNSYTVAQNPSEMTIPRAKRSTAYKKTWKDIAFFSWGTFIEGQEISLKWPFMPTAQFASLDAIYLADATVVWDPQDGSGRTYNVEVADFTGGYHIKLANAAGNFRKDCEMLLVIISEV